jgi:hypothetical protein
MMRSIMIDETKGPFLKQKNISEQKFFVQKADDIQTDNQNNILYFDVEKKPKKINKKSALVVNTSLCKEKYITVHLD